MSAKLEVDVVAQLKQFNNALGSVKNKVGEVGESIEKSNTTNEKSTKKLTGSFSEMGKVLGAVFAVDQLINFGKKIVQTSAEFEKMQAVLTTSLGSSSAAQKAMNQIVDFAAQTPFQVNELTDAFVKLTNSGFVPTMDQMRKMGDLASSTGKSFDQLAEAVLDAQTGEFERLKEFGVKAKQQGDVVQFTFKGITTEVAKSDTAIQGYLLSLGDLEGVSGSMEAIANTTSGALSNLDDNITMLFKSMGDSSSGFVNWVIKDFNNLISTFRHMSEVFELLNPFKSIADSSADTHKYLLRVNDSTDDLVLTIKDVASAFDKVKIQDLLTGLEYQKLFVDALVAEGNTVKDAQALWGTYVNLRKEAHNSEMLLAGATAKNTTEIKKNTEQTQKQAEAQKKAHDARIKQLRAESQEQNKPITVGGQRGFDGVTPTDPTSQMTPEKLQQIQNASSSILNLYKQITATLPGVTIPQDAADSLLAYGKSQKELAEGAIEIAENMNAALFIGDMFGNVLTQLAETGKVSFQSIIQALIKLIIKLAAAVAAAFALNILTGGAAMGSGMAGGAKGLEGLLNISKSMGLTPFANGGIVSGPTPALVGEYTGAKTNPEVIAPLNKLQNMMGGNVNFVISGDNLVGTLNRANKTRSRKF
jgi:hypothetical protein